MADFYTWTNPNSIERATIMRFLSDTQEYIRNHPERLTFKVEQGHLVINTLRGLVDKLPSELTKQL